VALASTRAPAAAGALGVSGHAITVDGRPTFLLGVSLFDALGRTPPRDQDLDALVNWRINIVRVWAHWSAPIYAADGTLTRDGLARLTMLVRRLEARQLLLELVLLRPGQLPGQKFALFASPAARVQAVRSLTEALRSSRGILFDLYNEHDHPDGPISHADARVLRDAVKAIDPGRIVTMSSTHLLGADGRMDKAGEENLRAEVGRGPGGTAIDVVTPHFPRTADWATATARRIAVVREALDRLGSNAPIYLDEERRAEPRTLLDPDAYLEALGNAREGGAAGWLFHTAAGFDFAEKPFLAALSPKERNALSRLGPEAQRK
jgi:hypothetical protein